MPFPWDQFLLVCLVLLLSSVLQGAIGFASGLFGIPLLMMITGLTLPQAVAVSLVASTVQNATAAWRMRKEIDFRLARRPLLIRLITLPLGVLALWLVGNSGKDAASILVGCVLLAVVLTQWLLQVKPREKLHLAWEFLAFGLGGFLLGLCGMGGPPMVLWVLAHDWPLSRSKALLFYLFAGGMLPHAICLWLFFGNDMLYWMLCGLAGIPVLLVGTLVGLKLGARLPDIWMRRIATTVLVLIGVSSLLMPLLPKKPNLPPADQTPPPNKVELP